MSTRTRGVDVASMVDQVRLPDGLQWFEVAGQKVFPAYGAGGGPCPQYLAILIDSENPPKDASDMGLSGLVNDERGHWMPIKFDAIEDHHSVTAKFKAAFEAMNVN